MWVKIFAAIAALLSLTVQNAFAQVQPMHPVLGSSTVSVSADGDTVLSTPWESPANELTLVNTARRTAMRLRFENPRIMLTEPTLASDAGSMAVVAQWNGYGPPPELWLIETKSGSVKRLPTVGRHIRFPVFSSDGSHIAYATDIGQDYRSHFVFVEMNVATGQSEQLSDRGFGSVCGLFYVPDNSGFLYCASDPISDDTRFDTFRYREHIGETLAFGFRRGESIPPWPTPVVRADATHESVRIVGVTKEGDILVRSNPPTAFPATVFTVDFARAEGKAFTSIARYITTAGTRSNVRASSTGDLFVFESECGTDNHQALVLVRPIGAECVPFDTLTWHADRLITAPLDSAFMVPERAIAR